MLVEDLYYMIDTSLLIFFSNYFIKRTKKNFFFIFKKKKVTNFINHELFTFFEFFVDQN